MRAKRSAGPLAKGFSILLFSHVRRRWSCKYPVKSKEPHCMPSDSFEQLTRPRRILVWNRRRVFGIFSATTTRRRWTPSRRFCARWEWRRTRPRIWSATSARLARHEWERLLPPAVVLVESGAVALPLHVPAEQLRTRARFVVRREDGERIEFELNLWELPEAESVEMDGRTWVQRDGDAAGAPAAGLPRGLGERGRPGRRRRATS